MRRAVGAFLRYVQRRDLHANSTPRRAASKVAGLLKYVAYRDKASARAELFGLGEPSAPRSARTFADFVDSTR